MWGGVPRGSRGRSVTIMVKWTNSGFVGPGGAGLGCGAGVRGGPVVTIMVKWTNSGFVGPKKCPPPIWVNATVINLRWTLRSPPCGEGQNCILGPRISAGSRRAPGGARSPLTFRGLPAGRCGPADTSGASGKNSGGSARRVHEPAYTNHQTYFQMDVFQKNGLSGGSPRKIKED